MQRNLINKKEIVVIVLVLLVCCLVFLYYGNNHSAKIARIMVDGAVYREINLSSNKGEYIIDIPSGGKTAHIKVSGDKIGFVNHECPDGICENAGMLRSEMQTAICLPLKVSIVIEKANSEIDIISG